MFRLNPSVFVESQCSTHLVHLISICVGCSNSHTRDRNSCPLTMLNLVATAGGNDRDRTADLRVSVSYPRASRVPTSHAVVRWRNT
jgi:hypothetical protein